MAQEFDIKFSMHLLLMNELESITKKINKVFQEHSQKDEFVYSSTNFALLAIDIPQSILTLERLPHIAPSAVLCRWYHELLWLYIYLMKNEEQFKVWKAQSDKVKVDHKILPITVRKYFESIGYGQAAQNIESWYSDYSNVIHGNANFVQSYHGHSHTSKIGEDHWVIIGKNMTFMLSTYHMFVYFFFYTIQERIDPDVELVNLEWNKFKDLRLQVIDLQEKQMVLEVDFLKRTS